MDRPIPDEFRFPEAGPRLNICFPQKKKYQSEKKLNVAILVSGGIAPGINAVIDGIVQRHWLYATGSNEENYELSIYGLINGISASYDFHNSYKFLVDRHKRRDSDRDREMETSNHAHEGGSILGTSRDNTLLIEADRNARLKEFVDALNARHIDILYVIGGDGSMRMAHALHQHALNSPSTDGNILSVVAVPKTMDNDILWVWQTFGFMSAVEKAREIIELVHTEITSNPRLGIVQLFGSVSGFVVSHAVLASSAPSCYLALVPEVPFELQKVAEHLWKRIEGVPSGLIVMAETALPKDYKDILNELDEPILSDKEMNEVEEFSRLQECGIARPGQTSDELRSACLKIVRHGLEHLLKHGDKKSWGGSKGDWSRLRMLTNEPRHIIRAIPPSSQDIINCRRLGSLAVDNAMAGYRDFMISQWLTEFVLVPLPLVTLGRKQIHKNGVFWKAVLAKTGSLELFEGTPTGAS
jgi:6-phosphofructokinase 1